MNHSWARRHSSTLEPEDRFIQILRQMDPGGEMTEEINRVEIEVKKARKTTKPRSSKKKYRLGAPKSGK
ncbi:hypothetical protein HAV21_20250 [Paenarthrobacter sp. MSM-2-10-13]|uniref:hypothetical protein n=1 Tax=Paenarthrobacter sp. MSM-2-10-13 TaxID=2717318 RepID=UPI001422E8B7|nr:hypothetical protein [Paenarthrobacter sp. MSM-2-10-13]NHW49196.1 hypothetical protein [Paenarthrobacter sp. MSM-2-10-13]